MIKTTVNMSIKNLKKMYEKTNNLSLDAEMQRCASDPDKLCELVAQREEADGQLLGKMEEWEAVSAELENA